MGTMSDPCFGNHDGDHDGAEPERDDPTVIPTPAGPVHMKPMPADTVCEIHEWSDEKVAAELLALMADRHGKGGVNVCTPCLERARAAALKRASEWHAQPK
jgi:hypothetical protein